MKIHKDLTRKTLASAVGAMVGILPVVAIAQSEGVQLSEIVVTAQKREQNVQEVPVAISVLGADAIDRLDIKDFSDVGRVSPALTIDGRDSPDNSAIRMRGVGTAVYSIAAEPSVSVVVDEVPLMLSAQAFSNLMDIERIEILRGPQGTLFGKNASAGVVSITTQAPTEEFSGTAGVRFTDDDEKKASLSLSGPISDTLSYRFSGYTLDRDGYITNLVDGSDLNGEEAYGVRGKLLWTPTDRLDMTLILDKSSRDASNAQTWVDLPASEAGEGVTPSEDNRKVYFDTVGHGYEVEQELAVFKLNYDLGNHVLTSITSYQNFSQDSMIDGDKSTEKVAQNPFLNPGGYPPGTPTFEQVAYQESDAISQELRLTSTASEKLEYMVGLFYSDVEHFRSYNSYAIRFILNNWDATPATESVAIFGQGSLQLTEDTYLDLGLRLNREKISVDFTDYWPNRDVNADPVFSSGSDSENAATGKVALRHFLDNGAMVYGSVSTGYKGQAYDVVSGFTQESADNPVGSESSISYEVGIKGTTEDGRLRYEAVAFLTDFEDYQAQGTVITETDVIFSLNNVGELRTKGIELDLSYQATDNLRLDFTGGWVDATIEKWPTADCYFGQTAAQGCVEVRDGVFVQDLAGEDLNNSPDFKFNAGAYWEQAAGNMPFNWFAQANYQWQDEVNFDLFGAPTNAEDAYGIANFSIGVTEPSGRYQVALFVNNAFDERFATSYDDTSDRRNDGLKQISKNWTRESRRYGGIKASYSF